MSNRTRGRVVGRTGGALVMASLLSMCIVPRGALAQNADDGRSPNGLEVTGYVGAYAPLSKLADSGDTLRAEFSTKVAFGLGLDYWFGNFGVQVGGNYARPELTLQVIEAEGFPTSVDLGTTDLWMASATVLWRPQLSGSATVVRPYLGAGPGVVKVLYPSSDDFDIQDETRFALTLAGGAHVEISKGWFARMDLRDYISKFDTEPFAESKTQHDLLVSFGIGYAFH